MQWSLDRVIKVHLGANGHLGSRRQEARPLPSQLDPEKPGQLFSVKANFRSRVVQL